jgi:hypothetical protein
MQQVKMLETADTTPPLMATYSVEALLEAALDCSWSIHVALNVLQVKSLTRSFSPYAVINESTTSKSWEREAL